MKTFIPSLFALLVINFAAIGQVVEREDPAGRKVEDPVGEIRFNVLNVILLGTVEIGYEQYLGNDQSISAELHLNDRFSYQSTNANKTFRSTSVQVAYNFYFAGDEHGKLYVYPFFRYRFGEFTELIGTTNSVVNMNSSYIGIGGGYRWAFSNKIAFGPFVAVSRGFSEEVANRFSPVEVNAGFTIGYRF